jgi:hypothetical protein
MDDGPFANLLAKRRNALLKAKMAKALLKRFEKAKGCAPATAAELYAFLERAKTCVQQHITAPSR